MDNKDEKWKNAIDKLDDISFLIVNKDPERMKDELVKFLPNKSYKNMMEIKDGDTTVEFMIKGDDEYIDELLMITSDEKSLLVMCITGHLSYEEAKALSGSININAVKEQGKE